MTQKSGQYSQGQNSCQPLLWRWVDSVSARLGRLVWPPTCLLCRQSSSTALDLCAGCEADLVANAPACTVCGEPLAGASGEVLTCGACLAHPPPFHASFIPFLYAYPLDHLVRRLKFDGQLASGRVLGELFASRLLARRDAPLPDLIVPVPLGQRRYRQRGYNQAIELGRPIRRLTGVPLRADVVIRVRETSEQTALDRRQRGRNLRRAFALAAPLPGPHVAILDDVVTTGSTVRELAKVLRRAGATRVEVWAIARAGHSGR
jgi:ComF family protein